MDNSSQMQIKPLIDASDGTVIAGPGFHFRWGAIMNPSGLMIKENFYTLAKGLYCHWRYSRSAFSFLYLKGDPLLFILDPVTLKRKKSVKLLVEKLPDKKLMIEDFRLFCFQDKLLVSHALIKRQRKWIRKHYHSAHQTLSELDLSQSKLSYLGKVEIDYPVTPIEKNWVYFEKDKELYFIYSFSPFRVFKLTNWNELKFEELIYKNMNQLSFLGGFEEIISLSTAPIEYDKNNYLLLIHKCKNKNEPVGKRIYYHWGVLLEKETLLPMQISVGPLFVGGKARGIMPGVIFVMSVVNHGNDFYFTYGESDSHACVLKLSKSKLDPIWKDI